MKSQIRKDICYPKKLTISSYVEFKDLGPGKTLKDHPTLVVFHSVLHVAPKFHRGALGAPVEGK